MSRGRSLPVYAAALMAVGALLTALPGSAAAAVATDPVPAPDGPVSGRSVPALRGAAAVAAAPRGAERSSAARAVAGATGKSAGVQNITPWTGALHTVWGAFPTVVSVGAQANHTVRPDLRISASDPDVIYAPTLLPSGKSCIEVTTFYWQGGNGVGAWDWCAANPGFAAVAWIDANFVNTYTVPFNGLRSYTVRDVQTNATTNSWTAYLYNFTTSSWDALFTSADPAKLTNGGGGWDMFEVYTDYNPATGEGYYCTETYGTMWWATGIQIKVGSTWQALTPSNSDVTPVGNVHSTDFGCYSLSFTLQNPNNNWQVTH